MIRTYQEALAYINNYTWSQSRPGLERSFELLKRLGDPQKELRFIHVAGTNGKCSVCAMTERILREAGYRTGLYPSPYVEDFRERIQVNGEWISEDALVEITDTVANAADEMEDHPSQFELITAIGMIYFQQQKCDFVVLEVGMGGEKDSTNVIDAPEVAVITNIGLDHTEYLGDTVEEIAQTKCGIIKKGSAVVSYPNTEPVMKVIRSNCQKRQVRLYETEAIIPLKHDLSGQSFLYENGEYRLSLLGNNQLRNAATVLQIVRALQDRGFLIGIEAVRKGLTNTYWPARFEVLSHDPIFILDGGHNPQCAEALRENVDAYLIREEKQTITFLIGMLKDKDYQSVLEILKPYGRNYICIRPDSPRALPADQLAEAVRQMQILGVENVLACDSVEKALEKALDMHLPVVAFGSLYAAGEIRRKFLRGHKCGGGSAIRLHTKVLNKI